MVFLKLIFHLLGSENGSEKQNCSKEVWLVGLGFWCLLLQRKKMSITYLPLNHLQGTSLKNRLLLNLFKETCTNYKYITFND